jgi:photosystem II stability/assembly factor-like uncharacterized protein
MSPKNNHFGISSFFQAPLALVLLFNFFSSGLFAQYTLDTLNVPIVDYPKLFALNNTDLFYYGENKVYKTENAGNTWEEVTTDIHLKTQADANVSSIYFMDKNNWWVILVNHDTDDWIQSNSYLYKTEDAGQTFQHIHTGPDDNTIPFCGASFSKLYFKNELEGWLYGYNLVQHTEDGGQTWIDQLNFQGLNPGDRQVVQIKSIDDSTMFLVGFGSWISKSEDGGKTWTDINYYDGQNIGYDYYMTSMDFKDSNTGYIATSGTSEDGLIKTTTNGGQTWEDMYTYYVHGNNGISIENNGTIWIAAGDYCNSSGCFESSGLLYSEDNGASWDALIDNDEDNAFQKIQWLTPSYGFVTRKYGDLYRINNITTNTKQEELTNHQLSIFPNPTKDLINIQSNQELESIKLLDLSGRVLLDKTIESTAYQLSLKDYQKGMYFIQLVFPNGITEQKQIVVQ